jgi:hypothetical protein
MCCCSCNALVGCLESPWRHPRHFVGAPTASGLHQHQKYRCVAANGRSGPDSDIDDLFDQARRRALDIRAALYGAITLKDGKVEQTNFDAYQVLRIDEMPKVEVHIVPSPEAPTGVGEPGVAPIGPAVANAVFAVTGKRLRVLPFAVGGTA